MDTKKLIQILEEKGYYELAKEGKEYLPDSTDTTSEYLAEDIIQFECKCWSTIYKVNYNFSTKEISFICTSNWDHAIKNVSEVIDLDSQEMHEIHMFIEIFHKKSSRSYINENYSSFIILPDGNWFIPFNVDDYDRISYHHGKYCITSCEKLPNGGCNSDAVKTMQHFDSFDELNAHLFQRETVSELPSEYDDVLEVLREYHK